jgi:hypothetical protein
MSNNVANAPHPRESRGTDLRSCDQLGISLRVYHTVLVFRASSRLAAAYGIAVTMALTSVEQARAVSTIWQQRSHDHT